MMIKYDDKVWWSSMMINDDDWLSMMIKYDDQV